MKAISKCLFIIINISILLSSCKDSSDNLPTITTLNHSKTDSLSIILTGETDAVINDNLQYGFLLLSADYAESDEDAENQLKKYQLQPNNIKNISYVRTHYNTFNYTLIGVPPNSTIYYCAYTSDGKNYSIGNVNKLTVNNAKWAVSTGDAIISKTLLHVTVDAQFTQEDFVLNDYDFTFGFEFSTKEDFSDLLHLEHNSIMNIDPYYDNDYVKYSREYEGLIIGQTYYYRAVMSYWSTIRKCKITINGDTKSFTLSPLDITITTTDAQMTGVFSAMLKGTIQGNYNEFPHFCGFFFSETISSFTQQDFYDHDIDHNIVLHDDSDNFECDIIVKPNTTYYYTSFVKYDDNTMYISNEVKSFITSPFKFTYIEPSKITAHSVHFSCAYNDANIHDDAYTIAGILLSSTSKHPDTENYEFIYQIDSYSGTHNKDIEINKTIKGLKANTTYYYRPYISYTSLYDRSQILCYDEVKSFTTYDNTTIDGAVDIGLDVLWAANNLGATSENMVGDYYAWGETEPKNSFYYEDYIMPQDTNITGTQYDAATAKLGNGWRMPTIGEINELLNACWRERTKKDSVDGILLISKLNDNQIFFPFANFINKKDTIKNDFPAFWSAEKTPNNGYCSRIKFYFDELAVPCYYGMPIRPIYDPFR